jgi:DNA polymerase (family 10)
MPTLDAAAVAKLLHELGQRTALRGGNPYRSRAYTRAAESLLALPESLADLIAKNRLREIPGIGEAIADIVTKLHRQGTHPMLDELRKEAPESLIKLMSVPGLRPEKILKLHKELGISSIEELEAAARQNRLQPVKGLGSALQAKILQGIEIRRQGAGRRHMHRAAELLESAGAALRRSKDFKRIEPAGDFRRGCELVSDLSLVVETATPEGAPKRVGSTGELSVHLTDKHRFGITLLLATGSETHLDELRALAAASGMILDAQGLRKGNKVLASKSEKDIYEALGLPFIEPELREGRGEIALAKKRKLPNLVTDSDVKGILHAHTDRSDGVHTLRRWRKLPDPPDTAISA